MKAILRGATAIFAVIPGIGVLSSGALAPPNHAKLFGLFIEIVGLAALLLVVVNRKQWTKTALSTTKRAFLAGVTASVMLLCYLALFERSVVSVEKRGTSYIPLWTTQELASSIHQHGSRKGLVEHFGEAGVYELVLQEPQHELVATTIILITTISAVVAAIVVCFGALALRLQAEKVKL